MSFRFATETRTISDPDEDTGELIARRINPAAMRRKAPKLEILLRKRKAVKNQPNALKGETKASRRDRMMLNDAWPRVDAAIMHMGKGSTPETTPPLMNEGTTRRKAMALPKSKGAGKPGSSSPPTTQCG